jgi:hypothetical protein
MMVTACISEMNICNQTYFAKRHKTEVDMFHAEECEWQLFSFHHRRWHRQRGETVGINIGNNVYMRREIFS